LREELRLRTELCLRAKLLCPELRFKLWLRSPLLLARRYLRFVPSPLLRLQQLLRTLLRLRTKLRLPAELRLGPELRLW
jgi:hypothetical protein